DSDLNDIAQVDPARVAAIRREVDGLYEFAQKAAGRSVVARVRVGSLLRELIEAVDEAIEKIVEGVERQAMARRDVSVRHAEFAVTASVIGGIVAVTFALSLTALIVHSILGPLRRVQQGMAAI